MPSFSVRIPGTLSSTSSARSNVQNGAALVPGPASSHPSTPTKASGQSSPTGVCVGSGQAGPAPGLPGLGSGQPSLAPPAVPAEPPLPAEPAEPPEPPPPAPAPVVPAAAPLPPPDPFPCGFCVARSLHPAKTLPSRTATLAHPTERPITRLTARPRFRWFGIRCDAAPPRRHHSE